MGLIEKQEVSGKSWIHVIHTVVDSSKKNQQNIVLQRIAFHLHQRRSATLENKQDSKLKYENGGFM